MDKSKKNELIIKIIKLSLVHQSKPDEPLYAFKRKNSY